MTDVPIKEHILGRKFWVFFFAIITAEILCVFLAPYIFTQFGPVYDLSRPEKGAIGDAIGGTTAPIVGFFSSLLVFLSLYAQIEANRIIVNQFQEERDRYNSESTLRAQMRTEEKSRIDSEAKQRLEEKADQQRNEMFRTLLSQIQDQNSEVLNMVYGRSSGIYAVNNLAAEIYNGKEEPFFRIIENVVLSLRSVTRISQQANLNFEHKSIIADQILLIVNKLDVAVYPFSGESANSFGDALKNVEDGKGPEETPLTPFLRLLSEVRTEASKFRTEASKLK